MRLRVLVVASHLSGHETPTGWLLVLLVLLALLYLGWRTGRLGKLRSLLGGLKLRSDLKGVRIRPIALVPTVLLVIVVVLLAISH